MSDILGRVQRELQAKSDRAVLCGDAAYKVLGDMEAEDSFSAAMAGESWDGRSKLAGRRRRALRRGVAFWRTDRRHEVGILDTR